MPNFAVRTAMRKSQDAATIVPLPTAWPWIMAITGCGTSRSADCSCFGSSIVTQGALRGRQLLPELAHIGTRDKDAVTGAGKHEYPQRAITR